MAVDRNCSIIAAIRLLILCCMSVCAINCTAQLHDDTATVNKLLNDHLFDTSDKAPARGLQIANEGLAIAKRIEYPVGIVRGYQFAAYAYTQLGQTKNALTNYNEALRLARMYKLEKAESSVLNTLGILYRTLGDVDKAFECFSKALEMVKSGADPRFLGDEYNNVAQMLGIEGKFDESDKYYLEGLKIFQSLKDTNSMIMILSSMGSNYTDRRDYPGAIRYLNQALVLTNNKPELRKTSNPYSDLGYYYNDLQKFDSVLYYYNIAVQIDERLGDQAGIAVNLRGIAAAYFYIGQLDKSEEYFKRVITIAKALPLMAILPTCESDLAEVYAKKKDYANAYKYLSESVMYKDSSANIEKAKTLEELTVKFEVKEMESKNTLLENENKLQKLKLQRKNYLVYSAFGASTLFLLIGLLLIRQNKLRANQQRMELEQKQLLAQINPHFIFNCLNSIQQFVVQNDTLNANKYLADFALLMRQTLDNSKDGVITLKRELEYLENYLSFESMRFEDRLHYTLICAEDVNTNMVEIPSMIIQPFVENAIRHGLFNLKDRSGELSIDFSIENNHLICKVEDNGIGMEESQKIKEQRLIKYQSHGMDLTRQRLALVSKMNSGDYKITVIDKKDLAQKSAGTIIIIKFPLQA